MGKKRTDTFRVFVGLLAFSSVLYLLIYLSGLWWQHADYVFKVLGIKTLSPWPWIVTGAFFLWGARFERRMYLKWHEEPRALNKLESSRVAFYFGLGLASLLIGLVMLVYR
jgi:hypothetical protein